ncbi:hypothetical protein [Streptomyces sp. NPDC001480]|uniref:hypothetical protein n=1 Tax=Streptomyces sp. NPDC001480 TaxID=3364577 RepID=UPI00367CEFD4
MSTLQMLMLLLALPGAMHIGCAAAFAAWSAGTHPATALLIGGSATGTATTVTAPLYREASRARGLTDVRHQTAQKSSYGFGNHLHYGLGALPHKAPSQF